METTKTSKHNIPHKHYSRTVCAHWASEDGGRVVAAAGRTVEDDDDNYGRRATGDGPDARRTEPLWREKRWREKPNAVGLGRFGLPLPST